MSHVELFRNLMVMAAVDRKFTDEEVDYLALRSSRWGITDEQFRAALQFARSPQAAVVLPATRDERRQLLENLLQIMAADGELAPVEQRLFAEAAARMEISPDELNRIIDQLL